MIFLEYHKMELSCTKIDYNHIRNEWIISGGIETKALSEKAEQPNEEGKMDVDNYVMIRLTDEYASYVDEIIDEYFDDYKFYLEFSSEWMTKEEWIEVLKTIKAGSVLCSLTVHKVENHTEGALDGFHAMALTGEGVDENIIR